MYRDGSSVVKHASGYGENIQKAQLSNTSWNKPTATQRRNWSYKFK